MALGVLLENRMAFTRRTFLRALAAVLAVVASNKKALAQTSTQGLPASAATLTPTARLNIPLNTWVRRSVPSFPGSPDEHDSKHMRLVYAPESRVVYLWGGDYCVSNPVVGARCASHEELWSYDVAQDKWTLILDQVHANKKGFPRGRCVPGFAWDTKRKAIWMTGGQMRASSSEYSPLLEEGGLWAFDPVARVWSREGTDPSFDSKKVGMGNPPMSMHYDALTDSLYVHGDDAQNLVFSLKNTKLRDGVVEDNWVSTPFPLNDGRAARSNNNVFATDTKRHRVVMYMAEYGETWAYEFATRNSVRLNRQRIPPIANFTMVYDDVNDQLVLFGGGVSSFDPESIDIWVLNLINNRWSKPALTGHLPESGQHAQIAFDSFNNAVVLYSRGIFLLRLGNAR